MQLRPRGMSSSKSTPNHICWGQVEAAFQKAGVWVRGLLSWMHVVTQGR